MNARSPLKSLAALVAMTAGLLLGSAPSQAASITGLYNTGAGFVANQQDTHYALSVNGGQSTYGYETDAGWPVGAWMANNSTSQWLAPLDNQAASLDPTSSGLYSWVLTFDLTGYDPLSASLSGRWATDNTGVVKLNGTQIGTSTGFTSWSSFAASTGFLAGMNSLEFLVTNFAQASGNPTGLRVEFAGSQVSAVPLPAAAWLFGSALFGFIAMSNRRKV